MKEIKRLRRVTEDFSNINLKNCIKLLSDNSLIRQEKNFREILDTYDRTAKFIADDEKAFLVEIYNNILGEGGDRRLWEVEGFEYDPEDDGILHLIDTIHAGDIDNTDLGVLYRAINTRDNVFKEAICDSIKDRLSR